MLAATLWGLFSDLLPSSLGNLSPVLFHAFVEAAGLLCIVGGTMVFFAAYLRWRRVRSKLKESLQE
jgi:hypothetical protein